MFADDILMEIVYMLAAAASLSVCCYGSYFCFKNFLLLNRRKPIKMPSKVGVIIVEKVVEEEVVEKGPERQLSRQEKAKKREREREHQRMLEEASSGEDDSDEGGEHDPAHPAHDIDYNTSSGLFSSLFAACLRPKHPPIKPTGSGSPKKKRTKRELNDRQKKDKKEAKRAKKLLDGLLHADEEAKMDTFTDLEAGLSDGDNDNSLVKEGSTKTPLVPTERQLKAQAQEKKRLERRENKIQAEADAVAAEEARLKHEAYEAMLAAESDEQKAARKKAKEEKHAREKQEREDEAERKRALHVSEGLAAAFAKRREGALLAHSFTTSGPIEEGPGNSGALSLFDVDPDAQVRSVLDDRLEKRFLAKTELLAQGGRDTVLDNSGPPPAVWPRGWVIDPMMPLPVCLATMNHRKCMVLFNEGKSHGWFPGTISGLSKRKGFNFSVKFDKMETQSIEIDGIKSCSLDTEGEMAYNCGWCLLLPDPEYLPGDTRPNTQGSQLASRPATGAGAMSSRPTTGTGTGTGTSEMGASRPGTGFR